jgi:hypothetical protein
MSHAKSRFYYRARTFYRRFRAFLGRGWVCERTRIVVSDDSDLCCSPIFVVGTHRSGTSLLRRILDSHRNIACPTETFWLAHYSRILNDARTFEGFWNLGFDRSQALEGLRRGASYFHEAYRRAKGKPRWADKTPQYTEHLETLFTLFGPQARFVLIFRHPMDVAFSIWNRGWELAPPTGDRVADACRYVLVSGQSQLGFRRRHPEACWVMHYDRLVRHPERTLRRLCDFLGEPWDAAMLEHHRAAHDFGCEDPIARGRGGFHGSYDNWRQWSPEVTRRAAEILRPLMEKLGYTLDSPYSSAKASQRAVSAEPAVDVSTGVSP